MSTGGTFTFTTGNPIQLQGFRDGAAVLWAQDQEVHRRMKSEIDNMFDVFSDGTYPYEDFYKYVETGFLQGITEAETVNDAAANWAGLKVVAALSASYRLDLDQDEGRITKSYLDGLKNHPSALKFLAQAGIAVTMAEKTE